MIAETLAHLLAEERHVANDPIGLPGQLIIHFIRNDGGEHFALIPCLVELASIREGGNERLPCLDVDLEVSVTRG